MNNTLYIVKDTLLDIETKKVDVYYIAPSRNITISKDSAKRYVSHNAAMKALVASAQYFKQSFESAQTKIKYVAIEHDRYVHTYTIEEVLA